jgi:hypothetical protein
MNKLSEIAFSELENFNDSNSVVFTAVLFNSEDQVDSCSDWFKELGLIPKHVSIKSAHFITGNVRGDARKGADSRADYLIEFSESCNINPMVRLQLGRSIKWTSDFIDNFNKDYNY